MLIRRQRYQFFRRSSASKPLEDIFEGFHDQWRLSHLMYCYMYINMHSNPHGSEIIMPAPLNIRDIGQDRKAALELEAKATGNSISEVVRGWIDAGIAKSRSERERAAWIASAKEGIADETRHLEQNGPSLARFRQV